MRSLLVALVLLAVLVGCGSSGHSPGSTLRASYRDRHGSGVLALGQGQPLVDRTDLAPPSRPAGQLALFADITDAHLRDEESPARVPFLDRRGGPFQSTFRPQEALTPQVLADSLRSLNAMPLQAVVEGGDLIDNDQSNELTQALAAMRGGRVDPNSGAPGYSGVQSASDPDPFYYRPGVDAPRYPGLLAQAERPFTSPGLRAPWYPVLGNHDILVQGLFAPTAATSAVAVGSRRLLELSPGVAPSRFAPSAVEQLVRRGLPGATVFTPPDRARAELSPAAVIARLRAASGHGASVGGLLDYSFDIGRSVRAIVLDTVHRDFGSEGIVRPAQVAWLSQQLRAAGRRSVFVFSHQPLTGSAGGGRALALLDRDPHVVAAVAGHTHRNSIEPRRTRSGGYWLVTTASLVDYPQQARVFRLVRTTSGGVALETWLVDHTNDDGGGVARELAYLDAQGGRPQGFAGGRLDRNVRLYLPR